MSKIVSMSSGAIDPIAQSKRVFFRADTTTASLKVGQPVCYNSDSVTDHKERASDPTHLGLRDDTYEEGAQEFTGRLFIVEEPLTANLHAFAGIVKALGPKAGADGDMIEIFVPNGAVIPVWTDQACTNDRTIMGIRDSEADVSYPGRPIGIAKETKDRSAAADNGLVWAKIDPDMFIYQYQASAVNIPDECGANCVINKMNVTTAQTAGRLRLLEYVGTLTGTGDTEQGMVQFRCISNGIPTGLLQTVSIRLDFDENGGLETGPGAYHYANCALHLGLDTIDSATPNFSLGDGNNTLCAIAISYTCDESGGAPDETWVLHFNSHPSYQWDGLICQQGPGMIGDSDHAGGGGKVVGFDGDSDIRKIPVKLNGPGGQVYYILAGVGMAEVNSD